VPPLFTEPGYNMHTPEEIGIDAFQAERSPDGRYRTSPLKGLWTHAKGGFYHDGRFATLGEVIYHYDSHLGLGLSAEEEEALEQYLLSLGDAEVSVGTAIERPSSPQLGFRLDQNYPNPFQQGTTIRYRLEQPGEVVLEVYTLAGQRVSSLVQGPQTAGDHTVAWDGLNGAGHAMASGVYFYRLRVGNSARAQKMILVR
jgi:hypothetical protein